MRWPHARCIANVAQPYVLQRRMQQQLLKLRILVHFLDQFVADTSTKWQQQPR